MNQTQKENFIIADARWSGQHGIGRFSMEVLGRLQNTDIFSEGPRPLSVKNILWQTQQLYRYRNKYKVFFTPGFNPVIHSAIPFVFTIHDLIHLFAPGNAQLSKKIYYQMLMKPAVRRAHKILTVSEHSKKTILQWANIPAENVVNVSCGISEALTPAGKTYQPGYPYLLHVGNNSKAHKNAMRLIQAFARAQINPETRLLFTASASEEMARFIAQHRLENRVMFTGGLTETALAEYYRGAQAVVFPSLYEGFGLPVLEGMACGVPVLTSNVTSLPEVAGDAALMIDPLELDALIDGIEKIAGDESLRARLIAKGLLRAKLFSWDSTARKVQAVLNELG